MRSIWPVLGFKWASGRFHLESQLQISQLIMFKSANEEKVDLPHNAVHLFISELNIVFLKEDK